MVPITEHLNMICHNFTLTLGNILICAFPCIKGETESKRADKLLKVAQEVCN